MPDNKTRDVSLDDENEARHGKQANQKLKPYAVLQYLLRVSDADHVESALSIVEFLKESGIYAERRSIYQDVKAINKVALMLEEDCAIDEAEEMLDADDSDELKLIVYDKHKKGFYVRQRHFDLNDIRLLAECVYSAKFVTEGQAKRLVDTVCEFVSEYQAERIRHNVFLTDRVKTNNKAIMNIVSIINDAMSRRMDGKPHTPEKISFKYLKYSISNMNQQVERRKGEKYIVSPFRLLINDGNYYLLAFVDEKKQMRTYRIDRMKEVSLTGEPREGDEVFGKIDMKTYTQRVFSMYAGKPKRVTIRFINPLLDAVVDKFGIADVQYSKEDESHFRLSATVEISEQFFGWLLGFGKRAKLIYPDETVEQFKAYLDRVRERY